jgi:ATP-dependent Lon protease
MKTDSKVRMPRTRSKKDSDSGDKPSGARKGSSKHSVKRGAPIDDDDSVDSRGNIRGLIAYSEEDDLSESSSMGSSEQEEGLSRKKRGVIRHHARKAAIKARKNINSRIDELERSMKKLSPRSRRKLEEEDDDDETYTEEEEEEVKKKSKSKSKPKPKKRVVEEEEEEEETEEETEEEDEEEEDMEDEEEDEDEYDDDESEGSKGAALQINFGFGAGGGDFAERMIPKRHNMKKETADVKKFVKLLSKPFEENTIDDQIDQFKELALDKQKNILEALERKPESQQQSLMFRILQMKLPQDTQSLVLSKYHSLQTLDTSSGEYFKLRNWLDKLTSLPLGFYKDIPVKVEDTESCGDFMKKARKHLEDAVYGQEEVKMQIMQFIATKIANPQHRGQSLLLAGPPGIGKTSLIKNGIAKALNWPFQFISLGGDSDATTYTGHQLVYESSHAGKIVNSLVGAKSMSMVLMFDELDKISATPKGEEVQNLLVHLTDPVQNEDFEDKYLSGVPIDLSKVMFIFSANDLSKVDKVLLDRMNVITLQGYNSKEKLAIVENFLLPTALKEVNLAEKVGISKEVIEHIIREYASEEPGVREVKRCCEQIAQKINMLRMFNSKELPFHIADFRLPFVLKKEHVDLFLKKKTPSMDVSVQRMYL